MSGHVLGEPVTEKDIEALGGYTEAFFDKLHDKYGKVAKFYTMGMLNISLADADMIKEAHLKLPIRPDSLFPVLNYLGKENLLFRKDMKQIRLIRERYAKVIRADSTMQMMHDITIEQFEKALDSWEGKDVDVHGELGWQIYDIMGRIMFGGEWSKHGAGPKIRELHQYCIENSNRWAYLPDEVKEKEPDYARYVTCIAELREICGGILDAKRRAGGGGQRMDAFSLLLQEKNADGTPFFDREFAISTMIGFLNGAYDTTHSTLHWTLFHLAKFPEAQERLRSEIFGVVGEKGPFSLFDARKVTHMDHFVKESQRHKATTPFNMRTNPEKDVTIGGVHIPKGTCVTTPYFRVFKEPAVFGPGADDPMCFDATRFEGENQAAIERASFLTPFGGGGRMCLGFLLATVEIKAALICILRRSVLRLSQDVPLPMETILEAGVLQPLKHFKIRFESRSGKAPAAAPAGPPMPPPAPPILEKMGLTCLGENLTVPDFVGGLDTMLAKSIEIGEDVCFYKEMGQEWLLVNSAELGTKLLQQNIQHNLWPGLIAASSAFFGPKVLFILEGEEWMRLRRIMRGELMESQLLNFGSSMGAVAHGMSGRLEHLVGKEIDAYTLVTAYHLDAASKALYGGDIGCVPTFPSRSELVKTYIWFTTELPRRAFAFDNPALNTDYEADNEDNRLMKKMSNIAHGVILDVVRRRLATREADRRKGGRPDMLELFFQAYEKEYGGNQSAEAIEEALGANLVELLFAGFNTVSGTMTNAFYRLSQEPVVVRKIRQEVDSILGNSDRPLDYSDFQKLKYTQLVFQEAVRIYGPSPVMARKLGPRPTELAGKVIPPDTQAMVPLAKLAVDPRYWKDPLAFWPERPEWHDDQGRFLPMSRTRGAFMPFSDGPRSCVGRHFAKMEFTLLIATIFRKYDFTPAPGYVHGTSFNGFGFHPCDRNTQERHVRLIVSKRDKKTSNKL
eukprot:TRINITY_DN72_c0_g1_i1.p1 TRINITY_DN72_c0_g1~~TRINITY_DN72_c0_g1_i1.p1  ORF type:complete len:985 (+),score=438.09 TRINITY_DN72_c0_g1_i1:73-2955(+)